jgi:nitroreductase
MVGSARLLDESPMKENTMQSGEHQTDSEFSSAERDAVYKCIFNRRDVRGQFLPDPIPDQALARILRAAHHAPSVGFMQPWDFILVRDPAIKQSVRDAFQMANEEAIGMFEGSKILASAGSASSGRMICEGYLASPRRFNWSPIYALVMSVTFCRSRSWKHQAGCRVRPCRT